MTWDIFCTVVDNFGDIGVTWRIARQLAEEHHIPVRLWVDDLPTFRRIFPAVDPELDIQFLPVDSRVASHSPPLPSPPAGRAQSLSPSAGEDGKGRSVEVRRWAGPLPEVTPGEVVIEALGCHLPEAFEARMARQPASPVWLNLEHLSAEPWVAGVHGLPSPHPRLPLTKHFFLPGFTADTGGLTREGWLTQRRDTLQRDPHELASFWSGLALPAAEPGELRLSLFGYGNLGLPDLLAAWAEDSRPLRVLVPESPLLPAIAIWFGVEQALPGACLHRGNLRLHVLPMLPQDEYDRLLWACDLNFVRGEDSFVRAQFAARPLVWQAYVQEDEAHLAKLDAFLGLYRMGMDAGLADLTQRVWHAWNRQGPVGGLWPALRQAMPALAGHAAVWSERLAAQSDLVSNLLIFCEKKLE
jgi:uncharacterized repeat protein (TIGR03837 family)